MKYNCKVVKLKLCCKVLVTWKATCKTTCHKKFIVFLFCQYILFVLFQGFIQAILMSSIWHRKLDLTIEFWNSIFIYIFLFACSFVCLFVCFCLITKLLNSFAVAFLTTEIKRYLHVSSMYLSDYLYIHNIDIILRYTEN